MNLSEQKNRTGKALRFVKHNSSGLPGWAKRRCRKETIMLLRLFRETGDEKYLDMLREAIAIWRSTPWHNLPPDLPRDAFETVGDWLDRCYREWLK